MSMVHALFVLDICSGRVDNRLRRGNWTCRHAVVLVACLAISSLLTQLTNISATARAGTTLSRSPRRPVSPPRTTLRTTHTFLGPSASATPSRVERDGKPMGKHAKYDIEARSPTQRAAGAGFTSSRI